MASFPAPRVLVHAPAKDAQTMTARLKNLIMPDETLTGNRNRKDNSIYCESAGCASLVDECL